MGLPWADFGLVVGEGDAAEIAAEVFAVDFEVEAGLDLVGGRRWRHLLSAGTICQWLISAGLVGHCCARRSFFSRFLGEDSCYD